MCYGTRTPRGYQTDGPDLSSSVTEAWTQMDLGWYVVERCGRAAQAFSGREI